MYVAVAAGLVIATATLRCQAVTEWGLLNNPDETDLMTWARAARLSPVPFSTWQSGTIGPYWALFLAALGALGAPLTLAFAHLLSAVLLALIASALFVAASRAIGHGPALVVTLVWWFPIATTWLVGFPGDFSELSTEYLPTLLVVASALLPREQLAKRPWLFAVLGVLAGFAIGAKYQVAPLAVAFLAAQLIVLRPSARHTLVSVLWWLAGAMLPLAAIVLIMAASPTTNWTLVEQNLRFLASYVNRRSETREGSLTGGRVESTFASLVGPRNWPGYFGSRYYLLVLLAGLVWLGSHSERRSNVARAVLILGGFTAMLAGGMGAYHYLILLFGAVGLAVTMPVKPGARLFAGRLWRTVVVGALGTAVAVMLAFMSGPVFDRVRMEVRSAVTPHGAAAAFHAAAAAFSADSVNRDPVLARACPPGSPAMVWGYAAEIYIAQDWQPTLPYLAMSTLVLGGPANKESGEPLVRAGIDRAECIVDATLIRRPECPEKRSELLSYCNTATFSLPRFYPRLAPLIDRQFHTVPVGLDCDGCTVYVRNVRSAV